MVNIIYTKKDKNRIINICLFWFWLAVILSMFYSPSGKCDGIDHDKVFYEKDVIVRPDEITVWENRNGIWVKELPRYQMPNGHFMLDKNNVNYWRDFDRYPCHYPIWKGYECFGSNDDIRYVDGRKIGNQPLFYEAIGAI